jgi:hypothetical protein
MEAKIPGNSIADPSAHEYLTAPAVTWLVSALFPCRSDPEFKGSWARFHIDMGTADELALDVLLNMLLGFSAEVAGMSRIMVGGEHERWALPGEEEDGEEGEAAQRRRKEQQGDVPKVRRFCVLFTFVFKVGVR